MPFLVIFIFLYTSELHCQHIPISSFRWSKSHNFNLRSGFHSLQSVICSLQSVVCSLQSAVCSLQSAVCSLQMSDTALLDGETRGFFASARHFDFLDSETETSKCFEFERETCRLLKFEPQIWLRAMRMS